MMIEYTILVPSVVKLQVLKQKVKTGSEVHLWSPSQQEKHRERRPKKVTKLKLLIRTDSLVQESNLS